MLAPSRPKTLEQRLGTLPARSAIWIQLIDVREPNEYEIVSIPGATLIPKGEFIMGGALEKLAQDKRIVLHCKSGVRSAECLAIVHAAGFSDAVHVGGGVLAWVNQIEPDKPGY